MKKISELSNPFSCLNKAADNEMLFILRAKDPAAATTILFWIDERIRLRKNQSTDDKITEAKQCAEYMSNYHA